MVAPDNLLPAPKNVIGKPQAWIRSSASGLKFLMIGRKTDRVLDDSEPFTGRFCGVGVMPGEADIEQEVAMLVAVPPNPSGAKPGRVTYVYRHTLKGRIPILGDLKAPATTQTILSSDVDIVQVGGSAKMTLILLVTPEGH
jgi:hypothetical protein